MNEMCSDSARLLMRFKIGIVAGFLIGLAVGRAGVPLGTHSLAAWWPLVIGAQGLWAKINTNWDSDSSCKTNASALAHALSGTATLLPGVNRHLRFSLSRRQAYEHHLHVLRLPIAVL